MQLRKALPLAAAILAAGLLSLTPTSQANPPTGGPIATIEINGTSAGMSSHVTGYMSSGTQTAFGAVRSCIGGQVQGAFNPGTRPVPIGGHDLVLLALDLTCLGTPLTTGGNYWSIVRPGCAHVDFSDNDVHNGTVDSGTGPDFSRVAGVLTIPSGCVEADSFGLMLRRCIATVSGSTSVYFDEAIKTNASGAKYQTLVLDGTGLSYSGGDGACGVGDPHGSVSGPLRLNDVSFQLKVEPGTTTGIDFQPPVPTSGGPVAAVGVNGTRTTGTVPIEGAYRSGTMFHGGNNYGCQAGTAAGVVNRGPRPRAAGSHDIELTTLDLTCDGAVGRSTWSLDPGCTIDADFDDTPNTQGTGPSVHDGTVDTGTGPAHHRVAGRASIASQCITVTSPGGLCTAKVAGDVNAFFDEAVKTVNGVNYQELTLSGSGLSYSSPTQGCFGQISGDITLNNMKFDLRVASGTTTGIDFRQTA